MQIETSIGLPGGWHYAQADYRIPLKGELPSAKAVLDALLKHRLENNLPVGNPEGDLEAYVCEKFPTWCRRGDTVVPPPIHPIRRNVDLVIGWANQLYVHVGRLTLVPQKEAEARAAICVRCPMQMRWANECPPCVTSAQRLLTILRQGKDTPQGPSGTLNGCACHGWDNRTAVHLDAVHLPPQANPTAPAECWVRR
jgi:hypothetical protein